MSLMIKIDHLGAKDCLTGSCHLVQVPFAKKHSVNILVDCGKAQGRDPELPFDAFPVASENIHYLFLTHAHIDHIGRVPDIIEAGFNGEIICTHATKALLIPCSGILCLLREKVKRRFGLLNTALTIFPGDLNMVRFFLLKEPSGLNLAMPGIFWDPALCGLNSLWRAGTKNLP